MNTLPPCAGLWELFDSIDPFDHLRAADLGEPTPPDNIREIGPRAHE